MEDHDQIGTSLWLWGLLAAALAGAWGWILARIPDKRYVDNKVGESESRIMAAFDDFREKDDERDRQLFEDKIKPLIERVDGLKNTVEKTERRRTEEHEANQKVLRQILDKVSAPTRRGG